MVAVALVEALLRPGGIGITPFRSMIDQAMLFRHLSGAEAPLYYIAGPPEMVKDLRAMLTKQSVNDGDIHAEEFSGY